MFLFFVFLQKNAYMCGLLRARNFFLIKDIIITLKVPKKIIYLSFVLSQVEAYVRIIMCFFNNRYRYNIKSTENM